jgi:uncharacterized protein
MRRLLPILLAAVAILVAAALSGVGRPEAARGETTARPDTVTTLGHGTVTTVPDVATINAGVQNEAATAADALAQNSQRMEQVVAALKRAGGDELQTRQVSLYPRTDENGRTTAFVAQNTVGAKTKLADAGKLVDAAVAAGANTVEGPVLERSDRDALYRDALAKAVDDARLKAEALAGAGKFGVGKVVSVVEQGSAAPQPFYADSAAGASVAKVDTPIEPGTQDVEATVTVSFEITV